MYIERMLKDYGLSWQQPGSLTAIMYHDGGELILDAAIERSFAVQEGTEEAGPEEVILTDLPDNFEDAWLRAPSPFMQEVEEMLVWYGKKLSAGETTKDEGVSPHSLEVSREAKAKAALELAEVLQARRRVAEIAMFRNAYRRTFVEIPTPRMSI
jgi:hypothetical protein